MARLDGAWTCSVHSGYFISRQLLKPYLRGAVPSLKDFYLRRAFRILPAYFKVVALYYLWTAWRENQQRQPKVEMLLYAQPLLTLRTKRPLGFPRICAMHCFFLVGCK